MAPPGKLGVGCMMLENWSFRSDNLALLNIMRAGLFGDIVHVHCAHSHDCIDHWFFDPRSGADRWPARYLVKYNRDYQHKWYREGGGAGDHGGADGVMLRCFLEAVHHKQPLQVDVFDSVTMSAIVELSGQSIAMGGQPVAFPDFTDGKWETAKPSFAADGKDFGQ